MLVVAGPPAGTRRLAAGGLGGSLAGHGSSALCGSSPRERCLQITMGRVLSGGSLTLSGVRYRATSRAVLLHPAHPIALSTAALDLDGELRSWSVHTAPQFGGQMGYFLRRSRPELVISAIFVPEGVRAQRKGESWPN